MVEVCAFDLPVAGAPILFLIMPVVCFMLLSWGGKYIRPSKNFSKSKMGSGHTATWITVAYVLGAHVMKRDAILVTRIILVANRRYRFGSNKGISFVYEKNIVDVAGVYDHFWLH